MLIADISEQIHVIKCFIVEKTSSVNLFTGNETRSNILLYSNLTVDELKPLLVSLQQKEVLLFSALNGKLCILMIY